MKLFRYGLLGLEKPGVVINDIYYDVSAFIDDYNEAFFINDGIEKLRTIINHNSSSLNEVKVERFGTPMGRPSKIICIGLNYIDHAKETNAEIPKEPIVFFKSTTALNGPNDDVIIPLNSTKLDWEIELAVVIGKITQYVSEKEASSYIAGYMLHNDYSERSFQLERGGQWVKGKSCDTFAPLGPFLVTPDEIEDVHNLGLWLTVNDVLMQNGNTNNLIFNIPFLIHYLSQFMTLLPGDIISTGTPHGVGLGLKPPVYLKEGDIVELGINGLGSARQCIKAYSKNH